jgi:hypothetical protein
MSTTPVEAAKTALAAILLTSPTSPDRAISLDALVKKMAADGHKESDTRAALFEFTRDGLAQRQEIVRTVTYRSLLDNYPPGTFGPDDVHKPLVVPYRWEAVWALPQLAEWWNARSAAPPASPAPPRLTGTPPDPGPPATKARRSTAKGEARNKIVAALTKHHQYTDGSCLNTEPIRVKKLARQADVSPSTVTAFFQEKFQGHEEYRALCYRDVAKLAAALKLLNGEFSPHHLYGRNPPGEGKEHKDED